MSGRQVSFFSVFLFLQQLKSFMQHFLTLGLQFTGISGINKLFMCRDNSRNAFPSKLFWFSCFERVLDSFPDTEFYHVCMYVCMMTLLSLLKQCLWSITTYGIYGYSNSTCILGRKKKYLSQNNSNRKFQKKIFF